MAEKWMEERGEWIAKAIRREETSKVAYISTADQYLSHYFGIERDDIDTFEYAAQLTADFALDLRLDAMLISMEPVNLTVPPKREILGGGTMVIKKKYKMQQPDSVEILKQEEYPELIKDPSRFLINTVYPRRFEMLTKDPQEQLKGYGKFLKFLADSGMTDKMCEEKGANLLMNGIMVNPVDMLFDFMREFKGIVSDIKRKPEWVRDAGLAIAEQLKPSIDAIIPSPDKAVFVPMHLPPFLRPKEFEMCYWPSFKMLADYMVYERGLNIIYYFEKSYAHLLDFLQELPDKNIIGLFQEDDKLEIKKKLGGRMAISGWLSTMLLAMGTKEECIDHVKDLIDTMAPGGGFIIAPDNPMLFPVDGKPENLKAVSDYIFEHRF